MPQIDYEKCDGCGICVSVCSCGALIFEGDIVKFSESHKCSSCERWCGNCELACPKDAISCPFEIIIEK
ncbi:MAG: 4Fe-4S binding protein [Dehalococcoidales bacterium]|nr:4Fe-4S binding protein [Dehalococcoidales bacterium]